MSSPSSWRASFFFWAAVLVRLGLAASAAFFSVRAACLARLSAMSWGSSATSKVFSDSCSNKSPRACLQGNCRLGQEHRHTGASGTVQSTDTR